ncbi:hypothetical protein JK159_02265 [Weissella minor]|uniref:hypothetical protein n=1 Tax=Weissella minor TaxID=1620 RepID=UPI001BB074F3|nr:hypothetical protein [Weissella minor]MBS0949207.1 hypothetical protein [Weissella minor]
MSYQATKYIVYGLEPLVPMKVVNEEPKDGSIFVPLTTEWDSDEVIMFVITDLGTMGQGVSEMRFMNETRITRDVIDEPSFMTPNPGQHPGTLDAIISVAIDDLIGRLRRGESILKNGVPMHTQDKFMDHILQVAAVPLY